MQNHNDIILNIKQNCYNTSGRQNPNVFKRTWWIKLGLEWVFDYIDCYTQFLPANSSYTQRIYHVVESMDQIPICKHTNCNNATTWKYKHYQTYCSIKCNNQDAQVITARGDTMMEKYGARTTLQSAELKDKVKCTNIKKYGHENAVRNTQVLEKMKQTNMDRYGVDNAMKSSTIRNRAKSTMTQRHGAPTTLQSESLSKKVKQTNILKYGVDNPWKSAAVRDKIKTTLRDKYQVDYVGQIHLDPSVIAKLQDKSWIESQLLTKSCTEISRDIAVDITTVCNYAHRHKLTIPNHARSSQERQIEKLISSVYQGQVILNDRVVLSPLELDFYLPEHKLAIEVNGIYWHSTGSKAPRDKNYHFDKWKQCRAQGITLLSYTDTDLSTNWDMVKQKILYSLDQEKTVVGARKCTIGPVKNTDEFELLNRCHIQGQLRARSGSLGAWHDDELVAVINWAHRKKYLEITRYACDTDNNTSYPGLFSRLTRAMIKELNYVGDIVSFSNNDHSNGNVYQQAGFTEDKILGPAYWYTRDFVTLENRQKYMKSKIAKSFGVDMTHKTEWQAMQELGYHRYYDSGKIRWINRV